MASVNTGVLINP